MQFVTPHYAPHDLDEILHMAALRLLEMRRGKQIHIDWQLEQNAPKVTLDHHIILMAFDILFHYVLHAMPRGSTLTVMTRTHQETRSMEVSLHDPTRSLGKHLFEGDQAYSVQRMIHRKHFGKGFPRAIPGAIISN